MGTLYAKLSQLVGNIHVRENARRYPGDGPELIVGVIRKASSPETLIEALKEVIILKNTTFSNP